MKATTKQVAAGAIIICGAFAVFYPFAFIGVDPHHDGVMFKTALDLAAGETIFRDTFTQYGALTSYLQGAFLRLTSPTLHNLRLLTLLCYAAIAGLQYFSAAFYLPRSLAIAVALFWIGLAPFFATDFIMLPWASVFAVFFQLTAVISFQSGLRASSRRNFFFFVTGLLLGLTFLCRQPVGVLSLIGLIAATFVVTITAPKDRRSLRASFTQQLAIMAGFAIVIVAFLLANRGAIAEWWFQTVTWPGMWARTYGTSIGRIGSSLFSSWVGAGTQHLVILFLVELAFLIALSVFSRAFPRIRWAAVGLLIVFVMYVAQCTDLWAAVRWGGLASGMPLALLVAFFILSGMRRVDHRAELMALAAIAVASWHQYYPIADPRHLFWGGALSIGPCMYLLFTAVNRDIIACVLVFAAFVHPLFVEKYKAGKAKLSRTYVTIQQPLILAGMKIPSQEASVFLPDMIKLETLGREYPEKPFLLEGIDALPLVFASNLKNPSPIYVNWGFEPDAEKRRVDFIKLYHPIVIVMPEQRAYIKSRLHQFHYGLLYRNLKTHLLVYGPHDTIANRVDEGQPEAPTSPTRGDFLPARGRLAARLLTDAGMDVVGATTRGPDGEADFVIELDINADLLRQVVTWEITTERGYWTSKNNPNGWWLIEAVTEVPQESMANTDAVVRLCIKGDAQAPAFTVRGLDSEGIPLFQQTVNR